MWDETISLTSDYLTVGSDVEILGPGADRLTINAGGASRVFYISGTGTLDVTLSGLTIAGGYVNGDGAGIYNASEHLTLNGVVVADNEATGTSGLGGGLYSQAGSVTVINSEFYGNAATRGGAIRTQYGTTLTVSGSSFYDNEASSAEGALSAHQTTATIENSTFSGNSAPNGGAIRTNSTGQMTIVNSTIVNNTTTGYGGGIQIAGGTVTLHNTILANNMSSYAPSHDVHGTLGAASSYNIIGAGANGQSFTGLGNQIGTPTTRIDPLLAPLDDYGGPTKTHALLPGSQAIDAGGVDYANQFEFDQRGKTRFKDANLDSLVVVDVGAYEADVDEFFGALGV